MLRGVFTLSVSGVGAVTTSLCAQVFPLQYYSYTKKLFEERYVARILCKELKGFVDLHSDSVGEKISKRDLAEAYEDVLCLVDEIDPVTHVSRSKEVPFLPLYFKDPYKRTFTGISYNPRNKDPALLSCLPPIRAETLPAEADAAFVASSVERTHAIFRALVPDTAQLDFLLAVWAHIVQSPTEPPRVGIVLEGKKGCGKNTILDWFREQVVGPQLSVQMGGVSGGLEQYSVAFKLTLVAQFDEVGWDCLVHDNALKNAVTSPMIYVNQKYKAQRMYPNMTTVFMTTNSTRSVKISSDERRWCIIEVGTAMKGNQAFWNDAHAHLADARAARAWFQWAMAQDLSRFQETGFQNAIPKGPLYEESRRQNIDTLKKFLSAMCVAYEQFTDGKQGLRPAESYTVTSLWQLQRLWLPRVGLHPKKQERAEMDEFAKEMKILMNECAEQHSEAIMRKTTRGVRRYCFDWPALRKHLEANFEFDEELACVDPFADDESRAFGSER